MHTKHLLVAYVNFTVTVIPSDIIRRLFLRQRSDLRVPPRRGFIVPIFRIQVKLLGVSYLFIFAKIFRIFLSGEAGEEGGYVLQCNT